ncbi:flagellar hook-length control protein FliK [Phenylobacterium sp.]|uniref:flagellar hook-length control protein FliK n=1 Tax=Phenylobacterium sp. TaxID=1871053 RepID=UPI002FD8E5ED
MAAQVARKLQARSSHFEIQLQPEGLGRVDVRVDIDAQGRLTAALSFDNPQAASDLRQRAGELQRTLEQAGFDLSGGLSFQSPDDRRGAFAEDRRDQQGGSARAFASALDMAESADAPVAVRAYGRRPSDQGVDVRI